MKKVMLCAVAALAICGTQAQVTKKKPVAKVPVVKTPVIKGTIPVMKNGMDSLSYALGMSFAQNLKNGGIESVNTKMFGQAMDDIFNKSTTAFTEEKASMTIQEKLAEYNKKRTDLQKAEGKNYLDINGRRSGVITLADGMQYEIIKAGEANGIKAKATDTVVVNYIGTLTDGVEFDNSVKRGQAATFALNQVIRGWTEILQLMPKGSHWKVYIPGELAYGENPPQGSGIKPWSVLVFEIMLEDVKPANLAQH